MRRPKYLVVGGQGVLGRNFARQIKNAVALSHNRLDICELNSLYEIIREIRPRIIINTAAITDLNMCEQNKELCWQVNFFGVRNLVEVSQALKVKLIHISSDYAVNPVNTYGWSKKASESLVQDSGLVVRTTFYSPKTYLVQNLLSRRQVKAYYNLYSNPISIFRLITEIENHSKEKGILNLFTTESLSRFDFAIKFAEKFSISKNLIIKDLYKQETISRPLMSFVKSDVRISLEEDLTDFKLSLGTFI